MQLLKLVVFAIAMLLGTAAFAQDPNNNYGYTGSNPAGTSTTTGLLKLNNTAYSTSDSDEVLSISGGKVFKQKVLRLKDSTGAYVTPAQMAAALAGKVNTSSISQSYSDNNPNNIWSAAASYNSAASKTDTGTVSPVINKNAGYQFIGSLSSLDRPEATREPLLDLYNGVVTSRFTLDSGNNHQSLKGALGIMQSTDSGLTYGAYKILFNSPLDDRAMGGGQLDDGTIVTFFGQYSAGPTYVQSLGYVTCDANGDNVSSFNVVDPTTYHTNTQGGFYGHWQRSNGVYHQVYYTIDTIEIVDWTGSGITTRCRFSWKGILEPDFRYLGGNDWIIYCRNNVLTGDTARRIVLKSTDDLNSIQFVGYSPFTTTPLIEQVPTTMYYDVTRDNLTVMAPTRNGITNGLGGQADSAYFFMNTKAGALANTGWVLKNAIPRPLMGQINTYWYGTSLRLTDNRILWQYTGNYSVEVAKLYSLYMKYIPANSNGGLGAKEGIGLFAKGSPKYTGILDYRSTTGVVNLSIPLASNQVLFNRVSTQGFTNMSIDTFKTFLSFNLQDVTNSANYTTIPPAVITSTTVTIPNATQYDVRSGGATGIIAVKHQPFNTSGGTMSEFEVGFNLYNGATAKTLGTLNAAFYANTTTSITTAGRGAYFNTNIALPTGGDSVRAAIGADGAHYLLIGSTTTIWPTIFTIKVNEAQITYNGGASLSSPAFWSTGWSTQLITNLSTFTSIQNIAVTKALNDASTISGAQLTAATVTPAKLNFTSTRTSAATLSPAYGNDYTFTGTTSTWTLPAIAAGTTGRQNAIFIKNAGSGTVTLNTTGALNTLYYTSAVNTLAVLAGEAYIITPDGTVNNVYKCN